MTVPRPRPPWNWLVIILVHNEPREYVEPCLRSVRAAADLLILHKSGTDVTIRVVDDSRPTLRASWQGTAEALGVEVLTSPGTIAQKRNAGCKGNNADAVAFTDADCTVDIEWLLVHFEAYAALPESPGAVGRTLHQFDSSPMYAAARHAGFLIGFSLPELMTATLWGPCSNLSVRRAAFDSVGGFDEAFAYAAEDVDLGLRLVATTGHRLVCVKAAPATHAVGPFARGIVRRAWTWGGGEAQLLARHAAHRAAAPPGILIFMFAALGWSATDALIRHHWQTTAWFCVVYVIAGPFHEARETRSVWRVVIRARLLQWIFQLRTCAGLMRLGRIDLLAKKMYYGDGQLTYEWAGATRLLWEFSFFLVLAALVSR